MDIILRADEANGVHTRFTVLINGANCGQLCMSDDEAIAFYAITLNGIHRGFDTFTGKGHWGPMEASNGQQ